MNNVAAVGLSAGIAIVAGAGAGLAASNIAGPSAIPKGSGAVAAFQAGSRDARLIGGAAFFGLTAVGAAAAAASRFTPGTGAVGVIVGMSGAALGAAILGARFGRK
ncbi:MAG: hypothetical protein ABI200_01325 [Gaiellales bacterium]